eukprot:768551-Hanusia_phi.AAC.7
MPPRAMAGLVCMANVQEGRDARKLRAMAEAASSIPRAWLLRVFSDRTFHRSGFCLAGAPDAVGEAAIALSKQAADCIDLTSPERIADKCGRGQAIPGAAEEADELLQARSAGSACEWSCCILGSDCHAARADMLRVLQRPSLISGQLYRINGAASRYRGLPNAQELLLTA